MWDIEAPNACRSLGATLQIHVSLFSSQLYVSAVTLGLNPDPLSTNASLNVSSGMAKWKRY